MNDNRDNQSLAIAMRDNNDENALALLIKRNRAWMLSKAMKILKNPEDAEEAINDVYVKIWHNRQKWDPSKGEFTHYFRVVASNLIIDFYRKRNRRQKNMPRAIPEIENSDFGFTIQTIKDEPLRNICAEEIPEKIAEALLEVRRPQHRIAWILKHFEHYKYREIAEILKVPESSIKMWILRCNLELREHLADIGEKL